MNYTNYYYSLILADKLINVYFQLLLCLIYIPNYIIISNYNVSKTKLYQLIFKS